MNLEKRQGAKVVDLRFMDLLGTWQHLTITPHELDSAFKDGSGFDGSSIRGWQSINESDMLLFPDESTVKWDPFTKEKTLVLICDVRDPITREPYSRDPRNIAKKAQEYLKKTGIADIACFGPEAEFFIFDDASCHLDVNCASYSVDSEEAPWNENPSKIRHKEGYFPVPPADTLQDVRTNMVLTLENLGFNVEKHHHEVATAGQTEINLKYLPLVEMADAMAWYKYVCKNVAKAHGKTATFLPKPLFGDNGSGMHTHQSLWAGEKPLFAGVGYSGLSQTALYYIGGIVKHAPALCAFVAPTTNSYKRLVPGFEAPNKLAYAERNRSAAVKIPIYSMSPKARRIEVRFPDPSCNPYLAFAAMLMAGLDGIQNKIDPGKPFEGDIYESEAAKDLQELPGSLEEALDALEKDCDFLLAGDVFTRDVIDVWRELKRKEINEVRRRPNPVEFYLYYDV